MKRITVALVLAVCLSSLAVIAQDTGGTRGRGERSRGRDGTRKAVPVPKANGRQ